MQPLNRQQMIDILVERQRAERQTDPYHVDIPTWRANGGSSIETLQKARHRGRHSSSIFMAGACICLVVGAIVYIALGPIRGIVIFVGAIVFLVCAYKAHGIDMYLEGAILERQKELENTANEWYLPMQSMSHQYRTQLLHELSLLMRQLIAQPHQIIMRSMQIPGELLLIRAAAESENKFELIRDLWQKAQSGIDAVLADINDPNAQRDPATQERLQRQGTAVIELMMEMFKKLAMK